MFYSKSAIDRADAIRKDATALQHMRMADNSRLLPFWNGKSLIADNSSSHMALVLPPQFKSLTPDIFLGSDEQHTYFALDISELNEGELETTLRDASDLQGQKQSGAFKDLRSVGPLLSDHEGSLLAYARGLIFWNSQTRHCIRCGNALTSGNGGHVRNCSNCDYAAFPRTDPAVIMLVTHTDTNGHERCLLGRNPGWPEGVFSTLAGFVEPGETLEMAVQREVLEEASIETEDVRYVASQPWPFPRSIMLGFEATATTTDIRCDPTELADAHWFTREQLRTFGNWTDEGDGFKLPRTDSIARHLIDRWIAR